MWPVFASFRRVRGQVGGKLDGTEWTEKDAKTPDDRVPRPRCWHRTPTGLDIRLALGLPPASRAVS
jgi:hypothetical protein